jgi:hypothetical protein
VGVLGVVLIPLFAILPTPNSTEELLKQTAQYKLANLGVIWAEVALHILIVPATLALYIAQREKNRGYTLVATAFWLIFVAYSFASEAVPSLSLISLSDGYMSASTDPQRAVFVTAALVVNTQFLWGSVLVDTIFFFALLTTSAVMMKGIFGKPLAYLGIAAAFADLLSVPIATITTPALSVFEFIFVPLVAIWFVLVGRKLYGMGRRPGS